MSETKEEMKVLSSFTSEHVKKSCKKINKLNVSCLTLEGFYFIVPARTVVVVVGVVAKRKKAAILLQSSAN